MPPVNFGERPPMGPGGPGPPPNMQQQLPPAPSGMQYIPCIVPMNQDGGAQLPPGAVPVGHVSAAQLQSGALPLANMPGAFGAQPPPRPFQGSAASGPGPVDPRGPAMSMQPTGPRPSRGRSPAGRNNRQQQQQPPPMQQPLGNNNNNNKHQALFPPHQERNWDTVRERASPPRTAPRPTLPAQAIPPGPRPQGGAPPPNSYAAMQGMPGMQGMSGGMPAAMPGGMPGMQPMQGGSPMNQIRGPNFMPGPRPVPPPKGPQAQADGPEENLFGTLSQNTKEPWRPSPPFRERRSLSPQRPQRGSSPGGGRSPERRSPERHTSVGRRPSLGRRGSSPPRAGSQDRRTSQERRRSLERRKVGTFDRNFQPHISEWWSQALPNGQQCQVYLVAELQGLQQAAWRLNNLPDESTSAVDCHGVDLGAASGKLCLMQIAFRDNQGTTCFLFDIMQLGESIQLLMPFLTNPHSSKIFNDAQQHATVLAHKFGIMLQGVIDAQCAVEMLTGKPITTLCDFVEWCGVGPPYLREEFNRWERTPEVWAHRPIPKAACNYLVIGACGLQAGGSILWQRLWNQLGPSGPAMVANSSQHRVQMASSAGLHCRAAGLWTGETDFPEATSAITGPPQEKPDPELDDWLARRFGGPGGGGAVRREPSIRKLPSQVAASVMREGDSPRTASWRAAVAQMDLQRMDNKERNRSSSPDLESWIARRTAILGGVDANQSRRASSLPPVRSSAQKTKVSINEQMVNMPPPTTSHDGPFGFGLQIPAFHDEPDRRDWAEILEDEQAKEAEEEGDLFKQMEEERQRALSQQG